VLYSPHPGSGLGELDGATPYWAYRWAGGLALAAHLQLHPEIVAGRSVLDLGAGSGLVGLLAARLGAALVTAIEADPHARAAIALNAAANGLQVHVPRPGEAHAVPDIVLGGDVFYSAEVATTMERLLTRHVAQGCEVLVGDPFRRDLPTERLWLIATYEVPDMGDFPGAPKRPAGVFRYVGPQRPQAQAIA